MDRNGANLSESPASADLVASAGPFDHLLSDFPGSTGMEHVGWSPISQGLMRSLAIVEVEVGPQLPPGFSSAGVSLQVNLLVLHRAPQPFP